MVWSGFQTAIDRGIDSEVLFDRPPPAVLDRGASLDDEGDRRGPTLGRLPEGVSRERARCLKGLLLRGIRLLPELPVGYAGLESKPNFLSQEIRNRTFANLLGVIREIDIWRVAVLMVNRYADAAEARADRCADDLETEGDHTGTAIWRRVTVAIERLTDTTGPLH